MSATYPLTPGTFPAGYCPTSPMQCVIDGIAASSVTIPSSAGVPVLVQEGTPLPAQQNAVWWKIDSTGNPVASSPFLYANGNWVARHPIPPSDPRVYMILTSASSVPTDIWSLDGGDGTDPSVTAPTPNSGSFWTIVGRTLATPNGSLQCLMPIGVGSITQHVTETTTSTFTVSPGDNPGVGEATHVLAETETPVTAHDHRSGPLMGTGNINQSSEFPGKPALNPLLRELDIGSTDSSIQDVMTGPRDDIPDGVTGTTASTSNPAAHNNLPPYFAVWYIQRTARINIVGG